MPYRIKIDRQFLQQLEALPGDVRSVARRQVKLLADQPRPSGSKELDQHPGAFRVWLPRGHRLVRRVLEVEAAIDLLYVGPKSPDLYEKLGLGRNKE
jgi:mRNA-degrading endonuclease RelE of RelBE toxin-antitoxin system